MKPWKLIFVFIWCAALRCVVSIALLPYVNGYYLDVGAQVFQYVVLLAICCAAFKLDRAAIRAVVGGVRSKDIWAGIGLAVILVALIVGTGSSAIDFLGHSEMALALFPERFQENSIRQRPGFRSTWSFTFSSTS